MHRIEIVLEFIQHRNVKTSNKKTEKLR